jgi:hypothetical protein
VSSEIALHGFSYLGVLLTFVGVLGFLLFAFEDVADNVQPFVELSVAVVFFGWAWLLRRQRAENVANAMELLAGMILPLVLFAGFVDGAPFPPNFTDQPLVVVLVLASLALAVAYALVARRRPATMLRFLVVPLVWLAALALGLAFKTDERLMGAAITRFVAVQPALASVAIAVTVTPWARHRLAARSVPVVVPALVAAPLAYLLAVVLAIGETGLMAFAASLAGLAAMAAAYQLADHFNRLRPALLAMPILLAGALLPVAPAAGLGWAGAVAVAGYAVLIEWMVRRRSPDRIGVQLAALGLALGLGLTAVEPPAAAMTWGGASLWLHWRRAIGMPLEGFREVLTVAAAVAPLGFGWALWTYAGPGTALIVLAAIALTATVIGRLSAATDEFWEWWPAGTAGVAGAIAVGVGLLRPSAVVIADGALVAATATAAAAIGGGRSRPVTRLWFAGALLLADVFLVLETLEATPTARALVWATLGAIAVGLGLSGRRHAWDHVAAVGHLIATLALLVPTTGGSRAAVLSLWSAGWLVALLARSLDRGCLPRLLVRSAPPRTSEFGWVAGVIEWLVPTLFVTSASVALLSWLNLWDEFAANRSWTGVTLAAVAALYAAATHLDISAGAFRRALATGAVVAAVLGVAIAAPDPWSVIAAAAGSMVVAAALVAEVRHPTFTWFAWIMSGVFATLLAERAGVAPHRLYVVLLIWGAGMFAGGLVADTVIAGHRPAGEGLRVGWTRFPVFLGALAVPVSLGPNFAASTTIATWTALGAAGAYGIVARLLRSPLPTLPAYGLSAYGLILLTGLPVLDEPMLPAAVAAALLAVAIVARLTMRDDSAHLWSAWDIPPLVVAHVLGVLALVVAAGRTEAIPWLAIAGLSAAVGLWRRRRAWFDGGHLIALVGATFLGTGALVVGLALTSGRAMMEVRGLHGRYRPVANGVAAVAATAAWVLLAVWSNWDLETATIATGLASGGAALIVGTLGRIESIRRDTAVTWFVWSVAGLVAAAVGLASDSLGVATVGSHGAVACGVAGLAIGSKLLGSVLGRRMELAAAPLAGLSWLAVATAPSWDPAVAVAASTVGFGVVGLGVAILLGAGLVRRDAAAIWSGVATAGVAVAAIASLVTPRVTQTTELRAAIAVGLAMLALAWHLLGRVLDDRVQLAAVPLTGLAWASVASAPAWPLEEAAIVSALLGGAMATVATELHRMNREDHGAAAPLTLAWSTLGALLVGAAALIAADRGASTLWASAVAPGLALLAWAAGRGAASLAVPGLRPAASVGALGASTALVFGLGGRVEAIASLAVALAVIGSAVLIRMELYEPRPTQWLRPVELFTVLGFGQGAIMAAALLPDVTAMTAVLLVAGLAAALLSVVRRSPWLMAASPPLIAGGAMLLLAEAATGSVQWYTLPLGIVVLAEVEITRLMIRRDVAETERDTLVMVEYAGTALLVAPAIVELFVRSLTAGAVAFAVAVGLLLWAILTRVRRRAVSAAVVAAGTAVLMISAALAGNAPDSAALWIIAAGLGFTVMSAAGVVEAARSRRGLAVRKIDELMGGWQ